MIVIDAFFRFSGIGVLLFLAVIAFRDYRQWRSAPYLILACISVSALFLGFAPSELRSTGAPYVVARFLDIPHLVFVWLFALSLFEKDFHLRPSYIVIGILYCAPIFWVRLHAFGVLPPFPDWLLIYGSVTSLALMVHLCFMTLRGRADDLLEKRRASRIYFVSVIVFVTIAAALIDAFARSLPLSVETLKAISIWPAIIWGGYWMFSFNKTSVTFGESIPSTSGVSERDTLLRKKLETELVEHQAFKEPNLTIVSLASRLGVNQHRLRSLINQSLGYPNFSAFVNAYRVEAVKAVFADPKNDHLPILTISMDCGFKSLSPFNRAFKNAEGITPTEYRNSL